ncbi:hypothetical protein [Streptomyces sp. NPDC005732]|uniref:hypothetical protein n=1 Tax=Streptomyces sp. NPDC005732 TaxID=3157057 RepID=UPI00340F3B76
MTISPIRVFAVVDDRGAVLLTFPATATPVVKVITVRGIAPTPTRVSIRICGDYVHHEVHGRIQAAEFVDGVTRAH